MYAKGGKLARSSYFGIVDLAGIPKDRFWSYMAKWTDKAVLHLFPHWNWNEGDVLPVCCYTSYDRAELFVNGKSYGVREKKPGSDNCIERYRLMWENVAFESGEVEVRALDDAGNVRAVQTIRTAGKPARLEVSADRPEYAADGDDLCYVTVRVLDAAGNFCPNADTRLTFAVEGVGEFVASDNGCQTDLEVFSSSERDAFSGSAVGIFRTIRGRRGDMRIKVSAEGMQSVTLSIPVR
jgi:beta-galactosidase